MPQFLTENERQDNQERLADWRFLVWGAFLVIFLRFVQLQAVEGEVWRDIAENSQIRQVTIPSTRGNIYDRNRKLLADWEQSFNVTVIPAYLNDQSIEALAGILKDQPEALKERIKKNARWSPFIPITVAEGLDWTTFSRVEENRVVMPGVDTEIRPMRRYHPEVALVSHVLGYMGEINADELDLPKNKRIYRMGDYIGKAGIERSLEDVLRGRDGMAIKLVDALGREISSDQSAGGKGKPDYHDKLKALDRMSRPQMPGQSVVLTIDLRLQALARDALGDNVGSAIIMDVRTGELLALVSKPDFDPRFFLGPRDPQVWAALRDNPFKPMYNRAVLGTYPPGSVFKIVMAAAGLEEGLISTTTKVDCTGKFDYKGSTFNCWNKYGHGTVDLERAITESCDVYFYELGSRMGIDKISKWAHRFGLGEKTGIPLIGESPGLVPTREWSLEVRNKVWYPGETINVSIGQGYLLTTPLQALLMAAAVANQGALMHPQLVHHLEDISHRPTTSFVPRPYPRVMNPQTAAIIGHAMDKVVNDRRGTAYKYVHSEVVEIAGKTGTAQVSGKYTGKPISETPYKYRDHAWFVAYAPYRNPEIAVVVMVEHGGSGGAIAGVITKQIIEGYVLMKGSARNDAGAGGG